MRWRLHDCRTAGLAFMGAGSILIIYERQPPEQRRWFFRGLLSLDSWTLGPKPLCHRRRTGPHASGLGWTPWTSFRSDEARPGAQRLDVEAGHLLVAVE